jgi:hypothetical protein
VLITRTHFADRTEGILTLPDGQQIGALERPWLNNAPFVSCIPTGQYIVNRDKTGRFQWYSLLNVKGRSHIEIHPANKASQLEGCISPCMYIKDGVGYGSREACELILAWFGDNSFVLEIR